MRTRHPDYDHRCARLVKRLARRFLNQNTIESFECDCYKLFLHFAEEELDVRLDSDDCPREEPENFEVLGVLHGSRFGAVLQARCRNKDVCAIKALDKCEISERGRSLAVIQEKKLLNSFGSAFIVKLLYAFEDAHNLYLVMDYAVYGDLHRNFVQASGYPPENLVKLFAAQVVLALEYLHTCRIVHRDLKPANMLLFEDGYLKVGDFGLAKKISETASSLCGSIPYVAPEMILKVPYRNGVDWWSFGVSLYEILLKSLPFCADDFNRFETYHNIVAKEFCFPDVVLSGEVRDLITRLLEKDFSNRLGVLNSGADDVKEHPWFDSVDFLDLFHKRLPMKSMLPHHVTARTIEPIDGVSRVTQLCSNEALFKEF